MYHHDFNEKIGFWYAIALAGQSNGMAYGEGISARYTRQTRVPGKTTGS